MAFVASQGCAAPSSPAMQMSADVYPAAASGRTADAFSLPAWVQSYARSHSGTSVVVLRGGIQAVRVRTSTILIYEQIGGEKNSWLVAVYDARTGSLTASDAAAAAPAIARNGVAANSDGSVDLHFGLNPLRGKENNWIRTSAEIPW
jgi:hypothetical protein